MKENVFGEEEDEPQRPWLLRSGLTAEDSCLMILPMNFSPLLDVFVDVSLPPETMAKLREGAVGCRVIMSRWPAVSVLARAEPDTALAQADIAFGQPDPGLVLASERLRWMHVASSGITRYDTPEFRAQLKQKGIVFTHSPSVYAEPCANQVLCFMLAQSRVLPRALTTRCPGGSADWRALRDGCVLLRGQRALILGYGAIGRRLVELLRPFDMYVTAYRRRPRGDEAVPVIPAEALNAALAESDHVVNILPESAETRGFFDAARFAAIKPGAVFYNIGRGTTVNQKALEAALRSGHLRAAWLDVTDPEPLPDDHPLWTAPNCYITPHIAGGYSTETESLIRHFLENLRRFRSGEPMLDRVV